MRPLGIPFSIGHIELMHRLRAEIVDLYLLSLLSSGAEKRGFYRLRAERAQKILERLEQRNATARYQHTIVSMENS